MQHAQCGVIYFTTSATSWVCRTRQCTGVANGALQTQPGSCLVRQIAQKKGGKKKKVSLRPSPSTVIILGVHRGLSMIIGRAENKNLPGLSAGSSYVVRCGKWQTPLKFIFILESSTQNKSRRDCHGKAVSSNVPPKV